MMYKYYKCKEERLGPIKTQGERLEQSHMFCFLEDDSNEDQSCSSVPSSPLMTEVLAEFNGRMKSMDHGDIWFDWYFKTFLNLFSMT